MGLGAAARYAAEQDIRVSGYRARALAERLRGRLVNIPGCRVLDRGQPTSAIVSAAFDWSDSEVLVRRLRDYGINTSATFRRWAWYDMTDKGVEHAVRMSPHYYNTEEEIDRVVDIVREIGLKK
jgi:selenocysteine lyase/cysteine desulfurase